MKISVNPSLSIPTLFSYCFKGCSLLLLTGLFSLVFSTLSGCLPAALVAGAAAGGAIIYDHRDMKTIVYDREIANQTQSRIQNDLSLQDTHISSTSFNRIVLLVGQAPTQEQRAHAEKITSSVSQIRRIINCITIGPASETMERNNDAWITSKVKSQMLATAGLHSTQIKVITETGTVYLLGEVNRKQAALATDVAKHVSDVQQVVKIFEYSH